MLLPSFDGGVVNPDVRLLRIGEVMNSTKCAMTAFLYERDKQLLAERVDVYKHRDENPHRFLLMYSQEYSRNFIRDTVQPKAKQTKFEGTDNEFRPWAINLTPKIARQENCTPLGGDYSDPTKFRHLNRAGVCVLNNCPAQTLGIPIWDYNAKENGVSALEDGRFSEGNCTRIPDYSRFSLDPNRSMTIDLNLNASKTGIVNFSFIDATGLGALQEIIVAGNRGAGIPFPKLESSMRGTNIFNISAQMPQSFFIPRKPPVRQRSSKAGADKKTSEDKPKKFDPREYQRQLASLDQAAQRWKDKIPAIFKDALGENLTRSATTLTDAITRARTYIEAPHPAGIDFAEVNALDDAVKRALLSFEGAVRSANSGAKIPLAIEDEIAQQAQALQYRRDDDRNRNRISDFFAARREALSPPPAAQPPSPPPPRPSGESDLSNQASASAGKANVSDPNTSDNDLLTAREIALAQQLTPGNQFIRGCGNGRYLSDDGNIEIDYLALKQVLLDLVNQQNDQVHLTGGPDVTLDALTLTTSFQIVLDTSAATRHIFRIFPVVIPPVMGVRADHTHQLKLTLQGPKKKGDPQNAQRLSKSCAERLARNVPRSGGAADSGDSDAYCASAEGILLESIVDALEQNRGGSQTQ